MVTTMTTLMTTMGESTAAAAAAVMLGTHLKYTYHSTLGISLVFSADLNCVTFK